MVTPRRPSRNRRRGQRGFTLIELLVSITILAIIGGVVATAFSVGLKILQPGGPQDRMLAAHNLMVVEQSLGQDGARASCVQVPPGDVAHRWGSCSAGKFLSVPCNATSVCFGWPQASATTWTCHVVVYPTGNDVVATRTEYTVGAGQPTATSTLTREVPVDITLGTVQVVQVPSAVAGQTYPWVRLLPVTITSAGVTNAPAETLALHPVATDPAGISSAITSSGNPC